MYRAGAINWLEMLEHEFRQNKNRRCLNSKIVYTKEPKMCVSLPNTPLSYTMCVLQFLNQIASILLRCQHLTNHLTDKYPAIYRHTFFMAHKPDVFLFKLHTLLRMDVFVLFLPTTTITSSMFFFLLCFFSSPFTSSPHFSSFQFMMMCDASETTNIWYLQIHCKQDWRTSENAKKKWDREKKKIILTSNAFHFVVISVIFERFNLHLGIAKCTHT